MKVAAGQTRSNTMYKLYVEVKAKPAHTYIHVDGNFRLLSIAGATALN